MKSIHVIVSTITLLGILTTAIQSYTVEIDIRKSHEDRMFLNFYAHLKNENRLDEAPEALLQIIKIIEQRNFTSRGELLVDDALVEEALEKTLPLVGMPTPRKK